MVTLSDEAVRSLGRQSFRGDAWLRTFTEARTFHIGMTLTDAFDAIHEGAVAEGESETTARYRAVQAVSYLTGQHMLAELIDAAPEAVRDELRTIARRMLG